MSLKNKGFVQSVFSKVPATYELVNHILTLGLDIVWRKRTARLAAISGGGEWVDMCTGTGEMAVYLSRLAPKGTKIHAVDFSGPMMAEAVKKPEAEHINFVSSDIRALPFPDDSFNLITMKTGRAFRKSGNQQAIIFARQKMFSPVCKTIRGTDRKSNIGMQDRLCLSGKNNTSFLRRRRIG
jgi:ubiquinone/menaquinone biosynthesis C-methylase UbiE